MKIQRIEREISNKVFIGGYETVKPTIRVVAILEPGDDPQVAAELLGSVAEKMWVDALQSDIHLAIKRRTACGTVWSDDRTAVIANAVPALKQP